VTTLPHTLVDSLFPTDLPAVVNWERRYPPRGLPVGAEVTRYGPSPTGFVHIGGIYAATISRHLARSSGGRFFIRIEDTDRSRFVADADAQFARAFAYFGLDVDEGDSDGAYGPYRQSERAPIYASYARELLRRGNAYPCFCSRDELAGLADEQRAGGVAPGYYGDWACCRHLNQAEVAARLERGDAYVLRFRTPAGGPTRVSFDDRIRGRIELDANRNDAVILKTSATEPRLPTYHFAHAVDDHLMGVTLVVRGDEWLSSVPLHLQLFAALEYAPPSYAHIAPLMKQDGASRRKLSKRHDPEAAVDFYLRSGYPAEAVRHYLRGLANSRLADRPYAQVADEPLRLDEFGVSGPLVDLAKLDFGSREFLATVSAADLYARIAAWAAEYDLELAYLLDRERDLAIAALAVERDGVAQPRKDIGRYSEFRAIYGFFFAYLFAPVTDPADPRLAPLPAETVIALAADLAESYKHDLDADEWFAQVRALATRHGFAANARELKDNPALPGSVREVSQVVRVLVTGATRSPDLYQVSRVLGAAEFRHRIATLI
jgi:glutamyl-tRNA synthetase